MKLTLPDSTPEPASAPDLPHGPRASRGGRPQAPRLPPPRLGPAAAAPAVPDVRTTDPDAPGLRPGGYGNIALAHIVSHRPTCPRDGSRVRPRAGALSSSRTGGASAPSPAPTAGHVRTATAGRPAPGALRGAVLRMPGRCRRVRRGAPRWASRRSRGPRGRGRLRTASPRGSLRLRAPVFCFLFFFS